jgi:hypothetical protein
MKQIICIRFIPSLSVKLLLLTDKSSGVEMPLVVGFPIFLCVKCSRLMLLLFWDSLVKFRKTWNEKPDYFIKIKSACLFKVLSSILILNFYYIYWDKYFPSDFKRIFLYVKDVRSFRWETFLFSEVSFSKEWYWDNFKFFCFCEIFILK